MRKSNGKNGACVWRMTIKFAILTKQICYSLFVIIIALADDCILWSLFGVAHLKTI